MKSIIRYLKDTFLTDSERVKSEERAAREREYERLMRKISVRNRIARTTAEGLRAAIDDDDKWFLCLTRDNQTCDSARRNGD